MNKVSVFMLTYGHWAFTKVALKHLLQGFHEAPLEEVVILDTLPKPWNQDETQDQLNGIEQAGFMDFPASFFKIIRLEKNFGSPMTIKMGMKACRSENDVVFCSNDVFYGDHWLQPLIDHAYKPWNIDHVAAVAPFQAPEYEWDAFVNKDFRKLYFEQFYPALIHEKNSMWIEQMLNDLYQSNFWAFSRKFVARNQGKQWDELNYCTFYLKRVFMDKLSWDDRYSYLFNGETSGYGSDDHDFSIQMDNMGLFRITTFESFAHHLICGTNRKITMDDRDKNFKDIQSGNKFLEKWERDYAAPEILFPFELAPGIPKAAHKHRWKLRTTPMPEGRDPLKVDWGVGREVLNSRIDD